jgi:hypothetical protein
MENFRTFNIAVEFYRLCKPLCLPRNLKDQLERASSSVALNLMEGRGRRSKRDQVRFFQIAFGTGMPGNSHTSRSDTISLLEYFRLLSSTPIQTNRERGVTPFNFCIPVSSLQQTANRQLSTAYRELRYRAVSQREIQEDNQRRRNNNSFVRYIEI